MQNKRVRSPGQALKDESSWKVRRGAHRDLNSKKLGAACLKAVNGPTPGHPPFGNYFAR